MTAGLKSERRDVSFRSKVRQTKSKTKKEEKSEHSVTMNRSWESMKEDERLNPQSFLREEVKRLKKEQQTSNRRVEQLMKDVAFLKHQNRVLISHLGINEKLFNEYNS